MEDVGNFCAWINLGNTVLKSSNYLHQWTFQSLWYTRIPCKCPRRGWSTYHFLLHHRGFYVHSTPWNQCLTAHFLEKADQQLHFMVEETAVQRWKGTWRKSLGWTSRCGGPFCRENRDFPKPSFL